ncbi:exodeoxyribonuclease III [Acidisoma silvae]|uniref:Exodeoxyribonuclease III n=1 Tax=Acidisoma silvae TaxID=2802396 RepID=A0A963YQJ0_9PROT|nr:exodeoxyribonuclease III [Acidisoma silvae]MCB8874794.1 exodeoxyribonuclease III [Acidisoma silvae]
MRIATWNVNSVRVRQTHVKDWLARVRPDIVVLQEIKCEAPQFPRAVFAELGYKSEVVGQKAYNGVAALSHRDITIRHRALPGLPADDSQARYIEVETDGITVIGIYLPNGNSGGEAGFQYKIDWMDKLCERAETLLREDRDFLITGDFNVCPTAQDFAPGALSPTDALLRPESIARYRRLIYAGLTDAVRALHPTAPAYTFWDYQAGCWERDRGLRIDFALLSPRLAETLIAAAPDKAERGLTQPSDHVPLVIDLAWGDKAAVAA